MDKLRDRSRINNSDDNIVLSEQECAFLAKVIPDIIFNAKNRVRKVDNSIDELGERQRKIHNKKRILSERSLETQIRLETALASLDEVEERDGAPRYEGTGAPADLQLQSFLRRIAWREEKINQRKYTDIPWGNRELGDKWSFFVKINGEYHILNPRAKYSSARSINVITNRVPGTTYMIYTEGLWYDSKRNLPHGSRDIPLMGASRNGILLSLSWDEQKDIKKDLLAHVKSLDYQI